MRRLLLALAAWALLLPACGKDLPDPTLVDRLRVLALKVEPPELRGPRRIEAELSVLAVRPKGEIVQQLRWYRCSDWDLNSNSFMCPFNGLGSEELGSGETLTYSVDPDDLLELAKEQARQLAPDRAEEVDLLVEMIGVWDTVNVSAIAGDERVESTKRIVISGESAGQAAMVMSQFPGSEECKELGPDVPPNSNPVLIEMRYRHTETGEAGLLDDVGSVTILADEELELRPIVDWESLEPYPQIDVLAELPVCRASEEFPIVSWFCDGGKLLEGDTAVPPAQTEAEREDPNRLARLYTYWTAPAEKDIPLDGLVRCWAILRDGRGGTDWQGFAIRVE